MRLFYDEYTTKRRAEIALLMSDLASVALAVTFASGSAYFGRGPLDMLLIAAWAATPRAIAQFLDWLGRPRDFVLSLLLSIAFVIFTALLLVGGVSILLYDTLPSHLPLRSGTLLVVTTTWVAGFLLCRPAFYRIHDFLLIALIVLGLLQRMPHSIAWLTVFSMALFSSFTCRHLVHDVFVGFRNPPMNLQNARRLTLLATGATIVTFAAIYACSRPWVDRDQPHRFAVDLSRWAWNPLALDSDRDPSGGRGPGPNRRASGSPESRPVDGRSERENGESERTIGFTHRVRLRDLVAPRYDSRVVFVARPAGDFTKKNWRPDAHTLWKALAFSRFDAATATWEQDARYSRHPWPSTGRVALNSLERPDDANDGRGHLRLEVEVMLPAFRNLVRPYEAIELGPVYAGPGAPTPQATPEIFLVNSFGDVFPYPSLIRSSLYELTLRAPASGRSTPPGHDAGTHDDPSYLEVPSTDEIGIDLKAYAARAIGLRGSVREKTLRLLTFYEREFHRSDITSWSTRDADRLRAFLIDERVGDCTYYSTATALLLRAAGVSTRLVVGFVGGEWSADGAVVVRNARAHAWIEVYQAATGWHPVDPTAWAPLARELSRDEETIPVDDLVPLPLPDVDERSAEDLSDATGRDPAADTIGNEQGLAENEPAESEDERELLAAEIPPLRDDDGAWVLGGALDPTLFTNDHAGSRSRAVGNRAALPREPLSPWSWLLRAAIAMLVATAALLALLALLRPRRRSQADRLETAANELDASVAFSPGDAGDREAPTDPARAVVFEYQRLQRDLIRTRKHRREHQTPLEHGQRFSEAPADLVEAFGVFHRILYAVLYGRKSPRSEQLDQVRQSGRCIRRHLS